VYDTPDEMLAGRYRLIRHLGQGGMGRVWLARDETLRRDVAVKELVFPADLPEKERDELRERARREARAIARLNHPNVVGIHDVLAAESTPWIVMEFVPSSTLAEVLRTEGRMPPDRVARIGLAVLAALKAAHATGVLHRDVKPANVLLAAGGRVVLSDFGLASAPDDPAMTHSGIVLGSPSYLAPERLDDLEAGPESDLWSLGVTLYAAVEGKSPWQRSSAYATVAALVQREPLPPPTYAGPLAPVLEGLLTWDPAERLNADRAIEMLQQIIDGTVPIAVPPPAVAAADPVAPTAAVPVAGLPVGPAGVPVAGLPVGPAVVPAGGPRKGRLLLAGGLAVAIVLAGVALSVGLFHHSSPGDGQSGPLMAYPAAGTSNDGAAQAPVESSTEASPTASVPASAGPGVAAAPARTTATATKVPTKATAKATTKATAAALTPVADSRPLVNLASGRCVDIPDGNPATTAEIQLWDCQNGVGQAFTLTGDGLWHVVGKCLEMGSSSKGANLYLAVCSGTALQKFALKANGALASVENGYCVEPAGGVSENGTWLRTYTCSGSDYQFWHLG
jgi:hypothetical protein